MCFTPHNKSTWQYIRSILCLCLFVSLPYAMYGEDNINILLINSYTNNSRWSDAFIQPLYKAMAKSTNIHCEVENLNAIMIDNTESYEIVANRIIKEHSHHTRPNLVIMVDGMAFSLHDRLNEIWPNIPILLISRDSRYGPEEYYFSRLVYDQGYDHLSMIEDLVPRLNMTMIQVPTYADETIDLIFKIFPEKTSLKFLADGMYFNGKLFHDIKEYVAAKYPRVKVDWMKVDEATVSATRDSLRTIDEDAGILLSTWDYKGTNEFGYPTLMSGEQTLFPGCVNPIFTIRQGYLEIGSIGGTYAEYKQYASIMDDVLNEILVNKMEPRDIAFSTVSKKETILNYQLLKKYDVKSALLPPHVTLIDKNVSVIEQYKWQILLITSLVAIIFVVMVIYIFYQGRYVRSLESHDSLIKNLPMPYAKAYIHFDAAGRIEKVEYDRHHENKPFARLLERNTFSGDIEHLFSHDKYSEVINSLLTTNQPVSFDHHFPQSDTYYLFNFCQVRGNKNMRLIGDKKIIEIDIFCYDITSLRKVDKELKRTAASLDITLQVATIIPWSWNLETDSIKWNTNFIDGKKETNVVAPWFKEELTEQEYLGFIHNDDYDEVKEMLDGYHSGRINKNKIEYRVMVVRDGKRYDEWVEIHSMATEFFKDGRPKLIMGSMILVTERKRQELALREANERARESDRMKSAFLASISHEIRTPLNAITGFSQLLTETKSPSMRKKYVSIIQLNNDLLLSLIGDVLDLAKIESNSLDFNYAPVDLNKLLTELKETILMRVTEGVMVNLTLGEEECWIETDASRLTQIMLNLLTNAAKFTTKGSITFGYELLDDEIDFYVKDTGIGIKKEDQDVIFERFKKLDTFVQGSGLGLAICKEFVENMGGEIGVKSRGPGKGSQFWFSLPYKAVDEENRTNEHKLHERDPLAPKLLPILLVEANEDEAKAVKDALHHQYDVLIAPTIEDAGRIVNEHNPKLAIVSLTSPNNGDEIDYLRHIHKISPDLTVLAFTPIIFALDRQHLLSSGYSGIIPKPLDEDELRNLIGNKLQLNRAV